MALKLHAANELRGCYASDVMIDQVIAGWRRWHERAGVQSFIYEAEAIRVVMIDEKPWWVAADIATMLGYTHAPI